MKSLTQLFILMSLLISNLVSARAGTVGGGGGDALLCDGRLYSFDYVVTKPEVDDLYGPIKRAKSSREILNIIKEGLQTRLPTLAADLADFIKFNRNRFATGEKRLWVSRRLPLIDLKDEASLREIPKECLDAKGMPAIYQAVIRFPKVGFTINQNTAKSPGTSLQNVEYQDDPSILKQLEATSPVQRSFAEMHEFLRDYSDNPIFIQTLNHLLHSSDWFAPEVTGEVLRTVLTRPGLLENEWFVTAGEQSKYDVESRSNEVAKSQFLNKANAMYSEAIKAHGDL